MHLQRLADIRRAHAPTERIRHNFEGDRHAGRGQAVLRPGPLCGGDDVNV